MLWTGYNSTPQMQTWSEFLMMNFVPIQQQCNNSYGNQNNNDFKQQ